ncbi:uncharacterized protein LOC141854500 [Brevipalpus obovatus]|uniref:uncharacterized protein LOC141854500 n=1 Tax=Brevipalpus obovatus TaxID=246614 RepID=UPI003D9E9DD2
MELRLLNVLIAICSVALVESSGGHPSKMKMDFGINLPSMSFNLPGMAMPKMKITAVVNRSKPKKPMKIELPAISLSAKSLENEYGGGYGGGGGGGYGSGGQAYGGSSGGGEYSSGGGGGGGDGWDSNSYASENEEEYSSEGGEDGYNEGGHEGGEYNNQGGEYNQGSEYKDGHGNDGGYQQNGGSGGEGGYGSHKSHPEGNYNNQNGGEGANYAPQAYGNQNAGYSAPQNTQAGYNNNYGQQANNQVQGYGNGNNYHQPPSENYVQPPQHQNVPNNHNGGMNYQPLPMQAHNGNNAEYQNAGNNQAGYGANNYNGNQAYADPQILKYGPPRQEYSHEAGAYHGYNQKPNYAHNHYAPLHYGPNYAEHKELIVYGKKPKKVHIYDDYQYKPKYQAQPQYQVATAPAQYGRRYDQGNNNYNNNDKGYNQNYNNVKPYSSTIVEKSSWKPMAGSSYYGYQ